MQTGWESYLASKFGSGEQSLPRLLGLKYFMSFKGAALPPAGWVRDACDSKCRAQNPGPSPLDR